jgi:hypothetical protein
LQETGMAEPTEMIVPLLREIRSGFVPSKSRQGAAQGLRGRRHPGPPCVREDEERPTALERKVEVLKSKT